LAVGLIVAPFSFGAVSAPGRLALEVGAIVLLLLWLGRSLFRPTPLPSKLVRVGLAGLLCFTVVQAMPLGSGIVRLISPRAVAMRTDSRPPQETQEAERRLLGREPAQLDTRATLSLDPGATASALRTGAALVAALLVATTVAATCGVRRIALALLLGAAFQGLYGLLSSTPRPAHSSIRTTSPACWRCRCPAGSASSTTTPGGPGGGRRLGGWSRG
jgi:hypothetical protein